MIQLDSYATLVAATLVLLLGRSLVNRINVLRTFSIPKPVAGGLLVALVLVVVGGTMNVERRFDAKRRDISEPCGLEHRIEQPGTPQTHEPTGGARVARRPALGRFRSHRPGRRPSAARRGWRSRCRAGGRRGC